MLRLSWLSPDDSGHGYATVGKRFRSLLADQGATILPTDAFDWDALVIFNPPRSAHFLGPHPRPDVVFHTMTETNVIPPSWVNILNRAGLLWVPSRFAREVFLANGVTTPVVRCGYGVDPVTPRERLPHDGPFRVLAWGDSLSSRKNIMTVIRSFIAADLPNAELSIKLNIGLDLPILAWQDHSNIHIHHANWSQERLTEWIDSGDVGIYLSSGEGYGLMPMEMMATGLPMISVRHTGLLEYMASTMVLEVPSRERESPYFNKRFGIQGATEFVPDMEAAITHLRWASENRDTLATLGMYGAWRINKLTWEDAGAQAYSQLSARYET